MPSVQNQMRPAVLLATRLPNREKPSNSRKPTCMARTTWLGSVP